jgi:hypothetical protein
MALDTTTPKGYRKAWNGSPLPAPTIRHGIDCRKVPHSRDGMLHGPDDDTPFEVDGLVYCGRCHMAIDVAPTAPSLQEP